MSRIVLLALLCGVCQTANFDNMKLFDRLGFGRLVDSPTVRNVKTPGNSPIFFIDLPPSPYYYLNHLNDASKSNKKVAKFPTVPVDLAINGRPNKLYHYNLGVTPPVLDDITSTRTTTTEPPATTSSTATASTPSTTTPARTTLRNKESSSDRLRQKYGLYLKTNKKASSMRKYRYSYNGKPSSLYVLERKNDKRPSFFRRLS